MNDVMSKSFLAGLAGLFLTGTAGAQCTWTTVNSDSFEYTTAIPGLNPATVYQNTPQTWPGNIHSGSYGMYLNIVDGYSGLLFSRSYPNLCSGQQYRFNFWTRDAWTSTNNFTFNVKNSSGTVIATQSVITNSTWQNIVMPAFTGPADGTITFEIITNAPGGGGNDGAVDDLVLQGCTPNPVNSAVSVCSGAPALNLYNQATGFGQTGVWTGPSALTNGYLGTFTPGTNTAGTYVYTIDRGANCPDSIANVQVTLLNQPNINTPAPVSACGSYTLPAITGTSLSGNEKYYTGPNGTGTVLAVGTVITTSQTVYLYGGAAGCSDQETLVITVSAPSNAGFDNGASFCNPGATINLATFLSSGAQAGGNWAQTTGTPAGVLTGSQWNTQGISPGTYTFTYTVPGNGACPADAANFSITIGNLAELNLGNDTTLCPGQTLTLNAGVYDTYLWNNGSTNQTRFVNAGGAYHVKVGKLGANQIVNGDFENGTTGFTTQYLVGTGGSWGQLSLPGTYAITTSPNLVHNNFISCNDHTTNPGNKQMVINGASTPNTKVWCQNVPLQPNTDYQFGTWVSSVVSDPAVAQLQFSINNTQLGTVFSPTSFACNWSQFTTTWNSGMNTTAEICIVNQNTVDAGNDFALDDITFRPICTQRDTIVVTYSTLPVVNLGPAQNVCEGTTVTLDAGNPGMTYAWTPNGETTQTISPTTSGTYGVIVRNQFNCAKAASVTVSFEAQKHAGRDSVATLCSTTPQFNLVPLLTPGSTTGGTWETGDLPGTVTAAGIATTSAAGTYDFDYILTGTNCPNDTARMVVTVNQQPLAAPDQSLHHCNTPGEIVDLSGYISHPQQPDPSFWMSPDFPAANMNTAANTLDMTGVAHGTYHIYNVLPADSMCVNDTMKVTLKVTAVPVIDFSSDVTDGCQPLSVEFYDNSTVQGSTVYNWDLGAGQTSSSPTDVNAVYPAADCYDITLTITADGLCSSTLTKPNMICSWQVPLASFDFGPQQVYSDGPNVQFTNNSTGHVSSSWDFGDGEGSSAENPDHQFPLGVAGNYEVFLTVTSEHGCVDETSRIIQVKDQLLYFVPNTFTPDGDEYNNIFLPIMTAGIDFSDFHIAIYNRWGETVFESHDINTGWDGTYNGELVLQGVYTWKMDFGLVDTDERRTEIGHITLIR